MMSGQSMNQKIRILPLRLNAYDVDIVDGDLPLTRIVWKIIWKCVPSIKMYGCIYLSDCRPFTKVLSAQLISHQLIMTYNGRIINLQSILSFQGKMWLWIDWLISRLSVELFLKWELLVPDLEQLWDQCILSQVGWIFVKMTYSNNGTASKTGLWVFFIWCK